MKTANPIYTNDHKEIKCNPSDGKNWRAVGRQTYGGEAEGFCCCYNYNLF